MASLDIPETDTGAAAVWSPCATCWGQRRLYEPRGAWYVERRCPTCLGLGEVLQLAAPPPRSG